MTSIRKDLTERLPQVQPQLASEVRKVLDVNILARQIRGGLATKDKYLREKKASKKVPVILGK